MEKRFDSSVFLKIHVCSFVLILSWFYSLSRTLSFTLPTPKKRLIVHHPMTLTSCQLMRRMGRIFVWLFAKLCMLISSASCDFLVRKTKNPNLVKNGLNVFDYVNVDEELHPHVVHFIRTVAY